MPTSRGLLARDRSPMHKAQDFFAPHLFPVVLELEDLRDDFFSCLFEADLFEGAVVRALFACWLEDEGVSLRDLFLGLFEVVFAIAVSSDTET